MSCQTVGAGTGRRWRAGLLPLLLFAVLLLTACGKRPTDPPAEPSELQIASGDAQTGTVGELIADPLVVRVLVGKEDPEPDVVVAWQVLARDAGGLEQVSTTSDADGLAGNRWTLGGEAGAQRVRAHVSDVGEADFETHANPGPPATVVGSPSVDTVVERETRLSPSPSVRGASLMPGPSRTPLSL